MWDVSGKLLAELKGHTDTVWSASFSPNGKQIVTTSDDKTARVWDLSGKQLAELKGHTDSVLSASFSADGQRIVTASVDRTALVWESSGKLVAKLEGHEGGFNSVSFSPDGKWIVTASNDSTARVWDTSKKLLTELKGHQRDVRSASFSPDGKLIVTISEDGTTRVWDTNSKQLVGVRGHQDSLKSASFSLDGQRFVTVSSDSTAHVWDISGKLLAELRGHQDSVESASFSPDGKIIVTVSSDNTTLWDTNGKLLAKLKGNSVSFSPDRQRIITTSSDNTARVWDTNGKLFAELKGHQSGDISSASFSPDGQRIVTTSFCDVAYFISDCPIVRIWYNSGKLLAELKGHQENVRSASFSPDGKMIVTASSDKTARVWHTNGKLLAEIKGHQDGVVSASFSPDGKLIVTASWDGTARTWDTNGKLLATLGVEIPSSPKVEADRLRDLEFYAPNCLAALPLWQKALNIYREISDKENQAFILEKLGNAHYCLGDYTEAIKHYSQALEISKKINYPQHQVKNISNLGNVYNTLADYPTAIKYYDDALKILPQENSQSKAEILRGRGNVYNFQGEYDKAIADYSQALAIDEAANNSSGVALNKLNLASIYFASGDYAKALQYYKETENFNKSEALAGLGNTYLALGDTAKAIDLHQQSLEKARQNEDKEAEGNALNNLALALRKSGNLTEAEKHFRAAIEVWENLRTKLDDTNKISIFEKQTRTYRLLQEVLIAQNKIEEALEISERGRARAFVDLLARRITPNQSQEKITSPNIENIKQIANAQNATLVQYSIISSEFKIDGKQQTKESELYIWVIKPTGEVIFRKVDIKPLLQKENINLAELVTTTRESFGVYRNQFSIKVPNADKEDKEEQTKRLQQLHQLLIAPIANLLPTDTNQHVIFGPQGELFLVPFPALLDEQGQYLIEKHTILTAPSIQVLDLTRQQKQRLSKQGIRNQQQNVLVVGNPTMPKVELEPGKPPEQLKELKGAEKEAKDIAQLLNTLAFTGSKATKATIVQKMPQARIIHLATHGILDNLRGLGSSIALAPSGQDNGLLTAEEILNLPLNADLVVLSACDTGRGRITGDGVIGLSRSFISAGTPSVVVSLWSVPDDSTAFLMTQFYQNLPQKIDKATALREAMLTTKQKYPNPRQWAAFTVIGEAE